MKKLILCSFILYSMPILTAEIGYNVKDNSPLIQKYQSFTLGNKTFTHEELSTLSQEDRDKLITIAHPSYISQCYGLNDQHIQPKDARVLSSIVRKYPDLFKSFAIMTKNRDTFAFSCTEKSHSCICVDAAGPVLGMLSMFAYGVGTLVPACVNPMTYTMIGLLSSIPAGCCITELGNCTHYRCCTGEKIYIVANQNN